MQDGAGLDGVQMEFSCSAGREVVMRSFPGIDSRLGGRYSLDLLRRGLPEDVEAVAGASRARVGGAASVRHLFSSKYGTCRWLAAFFLARSPLRS